MIKVMSERELLELNMTGYLAYKRRIDEKTYPATTLQLIQKKRNELFDKYKSSSNRQLERIIGIGYSQNFIAPADYPGVFVDFDDVYAAVYLYDIDPGFQKRSDEIFILWMLLTNDEYIPVIPAIYLQKVKPFDGLRKIQRNDFQDTLTKLCHNLKYPICEIEELEHILEKEPTVRGRLSKHFLKGQIYDARSLTGLFDPSTISCEMSELTRDILIEHNYMLN